MVCTKCEKKLSKISSPSPFNSAARNLTDVKEKRKIGENKLLSGRINKYQPNKEKQFAKCRICRTSVHQLGSHYCQSCAYSAGICAMCGKKMLDTKNYRQTSV